MFNRQKVTSRNLRDNHSEVYRNTTYHIHCLGIYRFGNNIFVFRYILDHLVEGSALHLLPFQIRQWIGLEVEEDAALS